MLQAQELSGQYTTEWQWDMNKNTNWVNQLRLDLSVPLESDRNTIEAATLHLAKTGESVIGDWQGTDCRGLSSHCSLTRCKGCCGTSIPFW